MLAKKKNDNKAYLLLKTEGLVHSQILTLNLNSPSDDI